MVGHPRISQFLWLVLAGACLVGAGRLQQPLDASREEYELVPPGNVVNENFPGYALLTIAPGGLRAPVVNYLWIRAEALKQDGRHHEAMQLADLICHLMPRFPGVWGFHAWNLAWNISVQTHTPEERWLWVYNGVKLLRDKGIPQNPTALALYKELAWIYFSKMGQTTDEMHKVYKQRWSSQMQRLLAAPPYGEVQTVIDAFRPIAEAPLDKDRGRQGRDAIQPDQLRVVLQDEAVAAYAGLLSQHGVTIGEPLLDAYNRFSRDESVEVVRVRAPRPATETDEALTTLINDPAHAGPRGKLLAFVRAQLLWNHYKMDPAWMLHMMEEYHAPLDWRMVQSHGLYWVTYGIDYCDSLGIGDPDALNADRIVANNLKALTWNGRLTYTENVRDPDAPFINWISDWRYIEPTHDAHVKLAERAIEEEGEGKTFDRNKFRSGHINYLIQAIQMLYAGYRREQARTYFTYIKETYKPERGNWGLTLDEFVVAELNKEGNPIPDRARSQLQAAILAGFEQLAVGNRRAFRDSVTYAQRVYKIYQDNSAERNKLPPFTAVLRDILAVILVRPQTAGIYLDLGARHNIYVNLDPRIQVTLYDKVAPSLRAQCVQALPPVDFDQAFPAPAGLQDHRIRKGRRLAPVEGANAE